MYMARPTPSFQPMRIILDSWPPELKDNKFVLFCYSSNKKLIHCVKEACISKSENLERIEMSINTGMGNSVAAALSGRDMVQLVHA